MTQEVTIECGTGTTACKVVLTGHDINVFLDASHDERARGKEGEALVQGLLAAAPGGIRRVERLRGQRPNDGPSGEPAFQQFGHRGALIYAARYRNGKRNDGPHGEPAIQEFNYDSGALILAVRYRDDRIDDGPNGEPAFQQFNDSGALILAVRYRDGARVKELDRGEIEAMELVRVRVAADAIRAACPALRIS